MAWLVLKTTPNTIWETSQVTLSSWTAAKGTCTVRNVERYLHLPHENMCWIMMHVLKIVGLNGFVMAWYEAMQITQLTLAHFIIAATKLNVLPVIANIDVCGMHDGRGDKSRILWYIRSMVEYLMIVAAQLMCSRATPHIKQFYENVNITKVT